MHISVGIQVTWAVATLVRDGQNADAPTYQAPKGMVELLETDLNSRDVGSFDEDSLRLLRDVHVATEEAPEGWGAPFVLSEALQSAANKAYWKPARAQSCLAREAPEPFDAAAHQAKRILSLKTAVPKTPSNLNVHRMWQ